MFSRNLAVYTTLSAVQIPPTNLSTLLHVPICKVFVTLFKPNWQQPWSSNLCATFFIRIPVFLLSYTVIPNYNGKVTDRNFFLCSNVPFITGTWDSDPRGHTFFPATDFRNAQVHFRRHFTVRKITWTSWNFDICKIHLINIINWFTCYSIRIYFKHF